MRRSLTLGVLGVALALVAAGCLGFSVTKEVTGGGEPDGPFIVQIDCEGEGSDQVPFTGSAADYPQTKESVLFDLDLEGDASCLITEPEAANATGTTIACDALNPPEVECTDTPDGLLVEVDAEGAPEEPFIVVSLTVTNDIPTTTTTTTTAPPEPNALAIVTEPAFTG